MKYIRMYLSELSLRLSHRITLSTPSTRRPSLIVLFVPDAKQIIDRKIGKTYEKETNASCHWRGRSCCESTE